MGKNTETAVIVLMYGFNMLKLDKFSYPRRNSFGFCGITPMRTHRGERNTTYL